MVMQKLGWLGLAAIMVVGCGVSQPSPVIRPVSSLTTGLAVHRDTTPYFPATQGYTWKYQATAVYEDDPEKPYDGFETDSVEAVQQRSGTTVLQLRVTDDFSEKLRFPTVELSDAAVTMKGTTYWGVGAADVPGYVFDLAHLPMTPGAKWDNGDWAGETKTLETVTVPAGTFQAWKVDAFGAYDHAYTAVGSYWIAPGVGIVKSKLSMTGVDVSTVLLPANAMVTLKNPVKRSRHVRR